MLGHTLNNILMATHVTLQMVWEVQKHILFLDFFFEGNPQFQLGFNWHVYFFLTAYFRGTHTFWTCMRPRMWNKASREGKNINKGENRRQWQWSDASGSNTGPASLLGAVLWWPPDSSPIVITAWCSTCQQLELAGWCHFFFTSIFVFFLHCREYRVIQPT